jgi:hypothetical protein
LNGRFLRFAVFVCVLFVAMYLGYPLASNFLKDARGWSVANIGTLGSFQALGTALLSPLLGRLSDGSAGQSPRSEGSVDSSLRAAEDGSLLGRVSGLLVGQGLVWISALVLLLAGTFPILAGGYLLRGAYQGCRSLIQARGTTLGSESDRGLVLGATETIIAAAQVFAPYAAGWLYMSDPAYPLAASLLLIPIGLLLTAIGLKV